MASRFRQLSAERRNLKLLVEENIPVCDEEIHIENRDVSCMQDLEEIGQQDATKTLEDVQRRLEEVIQERNSLALGKKKSVGEREDNVSGQY